MSVLSSISAKRMIQKLQADQAHLELQDGDEASHAGNHFQTQQGQKCGQE